jgi:hypothetical protein
MATPGRASPQPTPETQHFWDGARENALLPQCCDEYPGWVSVLSGSTA